MDDGNLNRKLIRRSRVWIKLHFPEWKNSTGEEFEPFECVQCGKVVYVMDFERMCVSCKRERERLGNWPK